MLAILKTCETCAFRGVPPTTTVCLTCTAGGVPDSPHWTARIKEPVLESPVPVPDAADECQELTDRRIVALAILLLNAAGNRRCEFYQSIALRDFLESADVLDELIAAKRDLDSLFKAG